MPIVTKYICDSCGIEYTDVNQVFFINMTVRAVSAAQSMAYEARKYPPSKEPMWCKVCLDKIGFFGNWPAKPKPLPDDILPEPVPIEVALSAFIKETVADISSDATPSDVVVSGVRTVP